MNAMSETIRRPRLGEPGCALRTSCMVAGCPFVAQPTGCCPRCEPTVLAILKREMDLEGWPPERVTPEWVNRELSGVLSRRERNCLWLALQAECAATQREQPGVVGNQRLSAQLARQPVMTPKPFSRRETDGAMLWAFVAFFALLLTAAIYATKGRLW